MSEITILHLSDIHFKKKKDEDNNIFRKTIQERLIDAVKGHAGKEGNPDFVVITGDIAFSGKKEEYDEAFTFLTGLKGILPKAEFLAVPGNHDVDRDKIDEFFSLQKHIVLEDLTGKFLENEKKVKDYINVKFEAFREFIDNLNPGLYQNKEDYYWVKNYAGKNVAFLGLNSAWACEGDKDPLQIALGFPQAMDALNKTKDITNKILLLHHPLSNCFELKDFNKWSGEIFANCPLILHGHVHFDNALGLNTPSASCIAIGANAVYTHDGYTGFQFIRIRFGENRATVRVWPYKLEDKDVISFFPDSGRWKGQEQKEYFDLETCPDRDESNTISLSPLQIPDVYKKWIAEFHSNLAVHQLARKEEVVFISLPEVYIALKTANPFYKPMASEHKKENNEPVELEKASKTIAVEDLLGQWKCLLLRGDAGMGKTTLIKHLAYTMTHETSPGPLDGYLPVMVFLKDFWTLYKNALRDRQDNLTFEILLAAYLEKICCPLPMETITAYLAQDRALFLIDGLDEVPDEIRAALVDIIHQFQFKHNQNLFLITGRPHGIEGRALYCFGKHLRDIEPLSGQKVEEFIKRWFRAVSRQAQGLADVNAMYLISKIKLHEHTAVFTGNPLLLTALCVFCLVDGKRIPDQRADLYDRIVANLLYRRFYDPADMDKEIKVCEYLMDLAFTMHSDNIKSIEPYKARDLLMQKEHYPILADELPHEYKKRIEELFNGIEPVCGILNRLGSGEIEFAHLTFQEFLAAKQLLDRGMDYKPYLKNSWWKESLLLYLGLMNLDMKKPSNDLACKIIKNYKKPRIQLIGAKAIQDFQATRREEYALNLARESLLTIIQSNTSLAERFEAGEILGHLGDPRIDVFNPPMVLVKAGEFTRGSEKRNDEKPVRQIYLDEYMMGKYPVTNAEFKIFIQEGGYNQEEYWTMEGWQWREEEKISEPLIWYERRWNGPNFPVVGVSWYEASAYANWLSKKTGYSYCLPTEVQWEKAACGSRGFQYPWGNDFDKD